MVAKKTLEQILKNPVNFNDIKRLTGLTRKQAKLRISQLKRNGVPIKTYVDENDYQIYFFIDTSPETKTYDYSFRSDLC